MKRVNIIDLIYTGGVNDIHKNINGRKKMINEYCSDYIINSFDLTGDGIFNGLDLALLPLWLGFMYMLIFVLPKQTIKRD